MEGENNEVEEQKVHDDDGLYRIRPKNREIELMEFEEKQFGDSASKL